ncbi:MAG: hypothetical protein IIZ38_03770 [Sphingomonas sp.]|uniref:hypothetical protein n=1 Tax=unclassified Sphingomonas TaxID=196159 RepID=UPI002454A226|nr:MULTISPECIES: hypothetical protein [unclassified Sphingomonas]MBQ1497410.1 hypothetical protein [Sphingomonas sp.]MDH4746448.1 hypothetical protein [Sphingomonas sp. CBMAI 2297]
MEYDKQRFENAEVVLDGNVFRNCSFNEVILVYSGGPVEMADCSIERFSMKFGGDLAQGLFTLYQLFGTEGMLQIIRGFTQPTEGEIQLEV